MTNYPESFYLNRHRQTVHAATSVMKCLRVIMPDVKSAVDLGCGVGTWLQVLREQGVEDVLGIDGHWVDRSLLEIPNSCFCATDLTQPVQVGRRFDLAISLEVAEHLPPEAAETFIRSLTRLADVVLFSAAVPGQGGEHHLNEQWPDYWATKFAEQGFVALDFIRPRIWDDSAIPVWYRQNILLFVADQRASALRQRLQETGKSIDCTLSRVHPELYQQRHQVYQMSRSVRGTWRLLCRSIARSVRHRWTALREKKR